MKNVGVPDTPLRSAESTSSATRAAPARLASWSAELARVEAGFGGVADQVGHQQRILVAQQQVVHGPEGALPGGGLRGLGGELGVRVDIVQREVAPDVTHVTVPGQQFPQHRLGLPAVGAFEVAVLDDGDDRLVRAADVVAARVDGSPQVDERLGGSQQGTDLQPAKTSSNAPVNLASRSRMRNRNEPMRPARSMTRLRACWAVQAPSGYWVTPRMCTRWVAIFRTNSTYNRLRKIVSMVRSHTPAGPPPGRV